MDAKKLWQLGSDIFGKRHSLMRLWQEIADNFYPQRADFTVTRSLGEDFASNLMTSYPLIVQRELSGQISSMLRPTAKNWFHMGLIDPDREDHNALEWMEWATGLQRKAMYDPVSRMSKACSQADNDFTGFGQAVMSCRINSNHDALLYRTFHLRDVAWMEDDDGEIVAIWRKWKPMAMDLDRRFPQTTDGKIRQMIVQNKHFDTVNCVHMMVKAEMFDGDTVNLKYKEPQFTNSEQARRREQLPWMSIAFDTDHEKVMEAIPQRRREYIIPRWQTVSGSQYAFSPAAVAGLPEARLLQAMTLTLLEAGEKIANPPMVATHEAIRSDIAIYAGGVTWVDRDYDERLGEVLRPMTTDAKGMPLGIDMARDARSMLMQAFFLNKLQLPQRNPQMTAFEVGQYVAQYIRDAMPLFEPMESEYNGALCDETFAVLVDNGAFGNPQNMPDGIRGADFKWRFESPLHDAIEQQKGQIWLQGKGIIADAAASIDPTVVAMLDPVTALRDVLNGIGFEQKWMHSEEEAKKMVDDERQKAAMQQSLATMQAGSETAKNLASAQKDTAAAQAPATI